MIEKIIEYMSIFLALLLVLPLHEFAHAFAAVKSGDITPKLYHRYTLNPLAHFDIFGLICFVVAHFGWAKPVPVNPNNFKHYKRDSFFVAIAGVSANYILAFLAFPLFLLAIKYLPDLGLFDDVILQTFYYIYNMSIVFFVFNLLPIYPLDGFRVVDTFSKKRSKIYWFLRNYGQYILLALVALSFISDLTGLWQIDILSLTIGFLSGIFATPITAFWQWIWGLFI